MSSVVISGDTSGTVTVTVPAVAGTNTLTLPAVTGNVITSGDTGTVTATMVSTSASAGFGLCKAWVNYNSTAQTITASFNVSSVTYNSTGNFTVNFTNAFSDAKYIVFGSTNDTNGSSMIQYASTPQTTTSCAIATRYTTGAYNYTQVSVGFIR
jgi:hypothetical protein